MKSVIIIGAGGHGKVVADVVTKSGNKVVGFLDDNLNKNESFCGFTVLGKIDDYKNYLDGNEFIIAIGNSAAREKIAGKLCDAKWHTAIHPTAVISGIDVEIAEGTVVMANAVVSSSAKIGKHCIINTVAVVEHDNLIEDFVHVSVGAKLAGTVKTGRSTVYGIGCSVSNNISVCADCVIGAGSVVVSDIKEAGTYVGVPARKMI